MPCTLRTLSALRTISVLLTIACLTAAVQPVSAATPDNNAIYPGEELVYEVSYLSFTLGTIKTVTEPFTMLNGRKVAKVKLWIDSNPNIPFVSLHSIYESWMDTNATYSHKFQSRTLGDNGKDDYERYTFDYANLNATIERWQTKGEVERRQFDIEKRVNDGSSILYTARSMLYSKKSYRIPTVIMNDAVSTVVNFQGKIESTDIDAVSYPVRTVYINGTADWTGVYGLTGRFEGWFSDDDARIPIRAKMNLYVGSVTIELKSWKRGSWRPPRMM